MPCVEQPARGSATSLNFVRSDAREPAGTVAVLPLPVNEAWIGRPVRELEETAGCRVAFIVRFGTGLLPRPDTAVQAEDTIYAAAVSGTTIPFEWQVTNLGSGDAPGVWMDRIFLSMDDELDVVGDLAIGERLRTEKQWRNGNGGPTGVLDEGVIAEVLANATGIPVFKLTEEESARLIFMEKALHQRVIGQDEAISVLAKTIRRQRAGLKDPRRPSGSFIFAGPTGVGKTELAKALAEFLFDDQDALISLDMSEYSEKHTVSRLFGAPPGFVGFEEGGQLTEKVRRKPFSVVLFDEIEKAHNDIFNSLLQILEEGRLTDGQGRVVDFKNTVIIMTTNLGTKDISGGPVGFVLEGSTHGDYEQMRAKVREELKRNFKPEFLNRVDETIVFPQLSNDELLQIVDLFINRLKERLLDRDMTIELTEAAKKRLIQVGHDPALGARPLRRAVQHEIEDVLSEKILHGELGSGEHVTVDFADNEFVFTHTSPESHQPELAPADA